MGLEQGGSPSTEQALVSNFLSHFVKWTCEPVAKPRLQRRTPRGQIAGSCLTQCCWASPHSFPVRSQLHLFTSEKLPRASRLALRDWVFFWRQVLISLIDAFCATKLEVGITLCWSQACFESSPFLSPSQEVVWRDLSMLATHRSFLTFATPGDISSQGVQQVASSGFSGNTVEISRENLSAVGSLPEGSVLLLFGLCLCSDGFPPGAFLPHRLSQGLRLALAFCLHIHSLVA